jgi:hypothetical protein
MNETVARETSVAPCCGGPTPGTPRVATRRSDAAVAASPGPSPCCGTAAQARADGGCCGGEARAEAVAAGAACCG